MHHPFRLLMGSGLVLLGLASAHAQNLLTNGTMEGTYANGIAPGWESARIDTRATSVLSESAAGRSGKAQIIQVTDRLGGYDGWSGPSFATPINGTSGIYHGRDYEASVWVRSERREQQDVWLGIDNAVAWQPTTYAKVQATIGTAWKQIKFRFRANFGKDSSGKQILQDTSTNFSVRLLQLGKIWVDDASFRELTAADYETAPVGNLIRNASGELGTYGWQDFRGQTTSVTDTAPPHGTRVISTNGQGQTSARLQSWAFPLAWGPTYTLSLWMRGSSATSIPVWIGARGTDFAKSETAVAANTFAVTTTWTRYSFSFTPPPLPDGRAFLIIDAPDASGLYIDGVQLEAASAPTNFAPRAPIEAGLLLARTNGIFAPGETATTELVLYNNGPATSLNLRRRLRDVFDLPVAASTVNWTQAVAAGRTALNLDFTAVTTTGAFRAEVDVDDLLTSPCADTHYVVNPPAPSAGQNSPIGTHLDYDVITTRPRSAGAGWTKTWQTEWNVVETETGGWFPNNASAQEGRLNSWRDAGLKTLAVVGKAPRFRQDVPATNPISWVWYSALSLPQAEDYAVRLATRFGDRVAAWELNNEPDVFLYPGSAYTTRQDAYATEALAYTTGLRSVLPQSYILLGSATINRSPELWIGDALSSERTNANGQRLRDLVDGVSYHNYDLDPATTRSLVAKIRAKLQEIATATNTPRVATLAIWDTEWAPIGTPGSFAREEPAIMTDGNGFPARRMAARTVQGFIARSGEGVEANFLYAAYGTDTIHSTGSHASFYEVNQRPRPVMPAQAVAAAWLTGATQPVALTAPGVWGYRFLRPDGRTLYTVWADEFQGGNVNFTAPATVTATDLMGNTYGSGTYAAGSSIPIGFEPVYLLGPATGLQLTYGTTTVVAGDPASTATGTDFGSVEANYSPTALVRSFTLTNLNLTDITFNPASAITFGGTHAGDFTVETPPPSTLAPGATAVISIRFLPTTIGSRSATLTVTSSLGGILYYLAGAGIVASPMLELPSTAITAHVPQGGSSTASLALENTGRASLGWTASLPTAYTAIDSNATGGPAYSWYDIVSTGTRITFSKSANTADRDDEYSELITPGFPFVFYGVSYNQLRITTNGAVNFGTVSANGNAPFNSVAPPSSNAPNEAVLVLWDDLMMLGNISQAYYRRVDPDTFVISWIDVAYFSDRAARQSFQIVFKRDGTITGQYATIARSPTTAGFVIGLQKANAANQALLYSQTKNPPANSLAVRFDPPGRAPSSGNFTPGAPASWLSYSSGTPTYAADGKTSSLAGTVSSFSTGSVPLTFNTAGLLAGQTYRTTLKLTSNDTAKPTVNIPVTLVVDPPTTAVPPAVSVTGPANNSSIAAGANVTVTASASDADGTVDRVEFYAGSQFLGIDYTTPYAFAWTNVPAGNYQLTARAVDSTNLATTSAEVAFTATPQSPVVALTAPTSGSTLTVGDAITFTATATVGGSSISLVEFYDGANLLGSDDTAPYSYVWTTATAGAHSLTAKAYTTAGGSASSAAVNVNIGAAQPPVVAISSPTNNSSFAGGTALAIAASATVTGGTIETVEFYQGSTLLGSDSSAPYTFTWNDVASGGYELTAVAYSTTGLSATSSTVNVAATAQNPLVTLTSPTAADSLNNLVPVNFTATASVAGATIASVEFYADYTLLGTDTSAPYSQTWSASPGSYSFTAKAISSTGAFTNSPAVNATVVTAQAPVVSITSPENGASFAGGGPLAVTASATVADGSIVKVEFYAGDTLLGNDTAAPFSYDWSGATAGTYTLTARAFGTNTLSTTSPPIVVTVQRTILPANGLIAFWKLNETSSTTGADSSGATTPRPLTLPNTTNTAWTADGKFAGALDFDGTTTGKASFTSPELAAFTFSAWVRMDTNGPTGFPRVLGLAGNQIILRRDTNLVGLNSNRAGTGALTGDWAGAAATITLNTWNHIIVSFDNSAISNIPTFYVNGAKLSTTTITAPVGTPLSNAGAGYLGNRSDSGRAFDGRLDHVRIYDRVLTDAEAALLYADDGLEPPAAPTALSATATATGVQLAWTASPGVGVSYQVSRATDVAGPFTNLGSPTPLSSWNDVTTAPGTAYFYKVTSVLADLVGGTSAPASVTTWTALEAWRMQHFDTITPAGDAADNADPDFDGVNNLLEYALGGDPEYAQHAPRPVSGLAGSVFQITYLRAASDLIYQVEASTDLAEWTTNGVIQSPAAVGQTGAASVSYDPETMPHCYLRLKVSY